jgi:hypothetical protein
MPLTVTKPSLRITALAGLLVSGQKHQIEVELARPIDTANNNWKELVYEFSFEDDLTELQKTGITTDWKSLETAMAAADYQGALDLLDALWQKFTNAFVTISQKEAARRAWWHGATMKYGNLPNAMAKQWVRAIDHGTAIPAGCNDRGKHQTDPCNRNAQNPAGWPHVHEWDIGGGAGYRATVWKKDGTVRIFWSSSHGLSQYSYELVTEIP